MALSRALPRLAAAFSCSCALFAAVNPVPGPEELYRLDLLPRFKQSVKVAAFSSYDRTGGNDDGFSGKYSFIRKEAAGLVIAEMKGPGVVYRIWTPTPTADPIKFYFDGEAQPRIQMPFSDLFTGTRAPFRAPLAGSGGGGYFAYVPIPFAKSLKIVIDGPKVQFHQVNYAIYPEGFPIASYSPAETPEYQAAVKRARELFGSPGADITKYTIPGGAAGRWTRVKKSIAPGARAVLFESSQPGRIAGLRIGPAASLAGKARALVLRAYWDGDTRPAIDVPAGDLFGYAWGRPSMKSLVVGTAGETNYIYLPMPFDQSARIELENEAASGPPVEVEAEVCFAPAPRAKDEGRFYAVWRRENPSVDGKPFTLLETQGRGHIVGTILQSQGQQPGNTWFFEGDDVVTLDGEMAIHGTGSEDAFNGGWYDLPGRWYSAFSFPLSGCLGYFKPLGRTGAFRFFLTDAYAFRKSALFTIEHGGENNSIPVDYAATTFFYSDTPPAGSAPLPRMAARAVADPARVVFAPGWAVPVDFFSFENATLTKRREKYSGQTLHSLVFNATGKDMIGEHQIGLVLDMPVTGRYRILIEAVRGPEKGIVQVVENDIPVGEKQDLYAAAREKTAPLPLGVLSLKEGPNVVTFRMVGKNTQSSALGLELLNVVCERLP
jgi:hypothetical protein